MITNVQYYGMIAEKIGVSSEEITLDISNNTESLKSYFENLHPILKNMSFKIAVNNELTDYLDPNNLNAEIALLPPFAGG